MLPHWFVPGSQPEQSWMVRHLLVFAGDPDCRTGTGLDLGFEKGFLTWAACLENKILDWFWRKLILKVTTSTKAMAKQWMFLLRNRHGYTRTWQQPEMLLEAKNTRVSPWAAMLPDVTLSDTADAEGSRCCWQKAEITVIFLGPSLQSGKHPGVFRGGNELARDFWWSMSSAFAPDRLQPPRHLCIYTSCTPQMKCC